MKLLTATAFAFGAFAAAGTANAQAYGQATARPPAQAGAPASAQGGQNIKVSPKARPAIAALQKAVDGGDKAQIPALLQAAQAAAQTNQDRWFIAQLQLRSAVAAKDYAAMTSAVDAIVASGLETPERSGGLYRDVATELYNAKQYAQAGVLFGKALKANPSDTEALALQGQAMLLGGQKAEAAAAMQRAIEAESASGRKADETLYRVAVQAAFEANSPAAIDIARSWLVAYPSADSWRNTLIIYRKTAALDDNGQLALLRLVNLTGGMKSAADYDAYIKGLLVQSNYNEAHAVLDQAVAARLIDPGSATATSVQSKPVASIADLTAAAKTAASAMAVLKIGDRMYGTGEYAKAADLYRQAKARGIDAGTADLFTGVALIRAGDKAGARAALNAVSGPRAGIAKYWLLYVDQHP